MQKQWQAETLEELDNVAIALLRASGAQKKFAIIGSMGSGKTTLVASLCKAMDIHDSVSSPTFAIVQEYGEGPLVLHFDLYRIEHTAELEDLGFQEYMLYPAYIFIEWPELIEAYLMQQGFATIRIQMASGNKRMINLDI